MVLPIVEQQDAKSCLYLSSGLKRIEAQEKYCLPVSYLYYVSYLDFWTIAAVYLLIFLSSALAEISQ